MTVVRLKHGTIPDPVHWGSRTDFICARSPRFKPDWLWDTRRDTQFTKKPTTGLCAVLMAFEHGATQVSVIGFDRLMHPEREDPPHTWLAHDKHAEHALLKAWDVRELTQVIYR